MSILVECEKCGCEYEVEAKKETHLISICPDCKHVNDIEIGDEE